MSTRTILIPVDASKHSEQAFDWYVDNMYHKNQDNLILMHCHEMKVPHDLTPEQYHEYVESHDVHKKELEDKYKEKCKDLKFESYKFEFVHGPPGEAICAELCTTHADMVVMGSRGLGVIRRTLLGSCSDYVLHHSPVPVIIIPSQHHPHHPHH